MVFLYRLVLAAGSGGLLVAHYSELRAALGTGAYTVFIIVAAWLISLALIWRFTKGM